MRYLHGNGHIITGLESALEGASPGDRREVSLAAADGYGERDERLVVQVARSQFSEVKDLEVGSRFHVSTDDGEKIFTVTEIGDEQVTVDGNHPLAGVGLHFDVEIKDVREATAEELDHGHVH